MLPSRTRPRLHPVKPSSGPKRLKSTTPSPAKTVSRSSPPQISASSPVKSSLCSARPARESPRCFACSRGYQRPQRDRSTGTRSPSRKLKSTSPSFFRALPCSPGSQFCKMSRLRCRPSVCPTRSVAAAVCGCSILSVLTVSKPPIRRNSPEECASGWASREPWSWSRKCCSWTSRSQRSTFSPPRIYAANSSSFGPRRPCRPRPFSS